jgi:hypothetical protein
MPVVFGLKSLQPVLVQEHPLFIQTKRIAEIEKVMVAQRIEMVIKPEPLLMLLLLLHKFMIHRQTSQPMHISLS